MRWFVALIALCVGLLAQAASSAVAITHVWARATPPGSSVGVIYADVVASHADELLSIATAVAQRAELHATTNENGTMKMRQLESVKLGENQRIRFETGGVHVMLVGLREPLRAGTTFSVTFRFRTAGDVIVKATVIGPADAPPSA